MFILVSHTHVFPVDASDILIGKTVPVVHPITVGEKPVPATRPALLDKLHTFPAATR
jgi:hypothetical protein